MTRGEGELLRPDRETKWWMVWRCKASETLRLGQEVAGAYCPVELVRRRAARRRATRMVAQPLFPSFLFLPWDENAVGNVEMTPMLINGQRVRVSLEELEGIGIPAELECGAQVELAGGLFAGRALVVLRKAGPDYVLLDKATRKKLRVAACLIVQINA